MIDSRVLARWEKQLTLCLFLRLSLFYSFPWFISIRQAPQKTSLHQHIIQAASGHLPRTCCEPGTADARAGEKSGAHSWGQP